MVYSFWFMVFGLWFFRSEGHFYFILFLCADILIVWSAAFLLLNFCCCLWRHSAIALVCCWNNTEHSSICHAGYSLPRFKPPVRTHLFKRRCQPFIYSKKFRIALKQLNFTLCNKRTNLDLSSQIVSSVSLVAVLMFAIKV